MGSSSARKELEDELKKAGYSLLMPPSSVDELLNLLDKLECLLSKVSQVPSKSMHDALLPSMKALITDELLRHADINVKVSVACCISELTRITAPDAPYNDEEMKEIFQLIVMAFEKLSFVSDRCHSKAIQILETLANVRSCLLMLDLDCHVLIFNMFQQFLSIIGSNLPDSVYTDMETIMVLVIKESEEVSIELLRLLLASVKKDSQNVSPLSRKLGEKIMENCTSKLRLCLPEAMKCMGLALCDYAQIVASICQGAPGREHVVEKEVLPNADSLGEVGPSADGLTKLAMDDCPAEKRNDDTMKDGVHLKTLEQCHQTKLQKSTDERKDFPPETFDATKAVQPETQAEAMRQKRGRKPNSLVKPEEGYNHSWIGACKSSFEVSRHLKNQKKKIGSSDQSSVSVVLALPSEPENERKPHVIPRIISHGESTSTSLSQHCSSSDGSHPRNGRLKKKDDMINQAVGLDLLSVPVQDSVRVQDKEKAPQSADVNLGKESVGMRDIEVNARKGSRKIELAAKNNMESTPALKNAVVKRKEGILTNPERKESLIQKMVSKKRRSKTTSEKHVKEEFADKNFFFPSTKSKAGDESHLSKVSKTQYKRKQNPGEEEDSKVTDLNKNSGEELVGCMIKVWWPLDQVFYHGAISSFDPSEKKHKVLYSDGDEEILDLSWEHWELVGDTLKDQEQETELPRPALSLMPRKKKAKRKSDSSIKKRHNISSSKRLNFADKAKNEAPRSSSKSTEDSTRDAVCIGNKLEDKTTKIGGIIKDDEQKTNVKTETETRRTTTTSKHATSSPLVIKFKLQTPKAESQSCTSK